MKTLAVIVSVIALVGTILPAGLFVAGRLDLDDVKLWMLVATVIWFVATPVWLKQQ